MQSTDSPFHGGDQWAEQGQFQGWWRRAASSCAGWKASSHGSSVYGEHPQWGSSGAKKGGKQTFQKCNHFHMNVMSKLYENGMGKLFTILRSLTTRVPPFLSPPTVLITVALGFSLIFFSILNEQIKIKSIQNNKYDRFIVSFMLSVIELPSPWSQWSWSSSCTWPCGHT